MIIAGIDAAVLAALLPLLPGGMAAARIPRDDIVARRRAAHESDALLNRRFGMAAGVTWHDDLVDGSQEPIRVRVYRPPTPAMGTLLYLHGGGLVLGTIDGYAARCAAWAAGTGCEVIVPEYRLAPEHRYPAAIDDCMTALAWARERAQGRPIAVVGDSAGGGLAAAVALRDRATDAQGLACQVLVYPMLDDRTVHPEPRYASPFVTWTVADNAISWAAYLGGSAVVAAPDAAPARATDLTGLPATYLDTGTLDLFHDEDIAFGRRLIAAGVPVDGHVWNGAPHGFDVIAPRSSLARAAWTARFAFVRGHMGGPAGG